jgi:hypothetical protein
MNYFVERHLARIDEYRHFAADMIQFLQAKKTASPEFKEFVENLAQTVQRIPQEYDAQKETMQSLEHAAELTRQTMALTATASPNNRAAYKKLLDAWRKNGRRAGWRGCAMPHDHEEHFPGSGLRLRERTEGRRPGERSAGAVPAGAPKSRWL